MQFLYDYHSSNRCLNATHRHLRLCRQIPGGAKYEQLISPEYDDLKAKYEAWDAAQKNVFAAHDMVSLCDTLLDDSIIKVNHRCSEYDKQNTGSFTRTTLFPKGNFTEITQVNMYREPGKALELAEKLAAFGTSHELNPLVAEVRAAVEKSNKAIKDEEEMITAESLAKSNVEIARLRLIRRYNSNYYQAADEGGKAFAEKLFPDLGGNNRKKDSGDSNEDKI